MQFWSRLSVLAASVFIFVFLASCGGGGGGDDFYISPCFPFPESWCTAPPAPPPATGPDTDPPSILGVWPVDGATYVENDTFIRLTFSEGMEATTLNSSSVLIQAGSGASVQGVFSYSGLYQCWSGFNGQPGYCGYSLGFDPSTTLRAGETYTITVTTAVKDSQGNPLSSQFQSSFTTVPVGTGFWLPMTSSGAPDARRDFTMVRTGNELLIWGGCDSQGHAFNTGASYDPAGDSWEPITTSGAPSARLEHTAIWTGTEMIIWGGRDQTGTANTGGRYDPATDTWTPVTTTNAPSGRSYHTAVWTGTRMIVWGGQESKGSGLTGLTNTGGIYDPLSDTWQPTSTSDAPTGRENYRAIWTGTEMVVWGGYDIVNTNLVALNTGGRYDPLTDNWRATSTSDAPSGRYSFSAVWSGTNVLIWGGSTGGVAVLRTARSMIQLWIPGKRFPWSTPHGFVTTRRSGRAARWRYGEMSVQTRAGSTHLNRAAIANARLWAGERQKHVSLTSWQTLAGKVRTDSLLTAAVKRIVRWQAS